MAHAGTHSNELPARSFAPLVDVDPPLVTTVVEMLTSEHIAAYAEPYSGETGPYRDVRSPNRPTSRILVDRERLHVARAVVASRLPQLQAALHADAAARADTEQMKKLSAAQVDAAWADLMTSLSNTDASSPEISAGTDPAETSGLSARLIRQHDDAPSDDMTDELSMAGGPRDYAMADEPEEGFSPPHPPPLPRPRDAVDRLAWGGAIGGPLLLVGSHVFNLGTTLGGVGVAASIAGFVTLVARMKSERESGDDGAVV